MVYFSPIIVGGAVTADNKPLSIIISLYWVGVESFSNLIIVHIIIHVYHIYYIIFIVKVLFKCTCEVIL